MKTNKTTEKMGMWCGKATDFASELHLCWRQTWADAKDTGEEVSH